MTEIATSRIERVRTWRDAALQDGWAIAPTYEHESIETAFRLTRDGFVVSAIARSERGSAIDAWGPDGLALDVPDTYDMAALIAGLRTCSFCGAMDVATQRVAFCNRSCAACAPAAKQRLETPGWCD